MLAINRGHYTGLLPSLFRYAEISLTTGAAGPMAREEVRGGRSSNDMDLAVGIAFVEATTGKGDEEEGSTVNYSFGIVCRFAGEASLH